MLFPGMRSYSKVPSEVEAGDPEYARKPHSKLFRVCFLVACFFVGVFGFLSAEVLSTWTHHKHHLQLEDINHTFHYNRTFSYPPSNRTNRAWRDMFPAEGGFFVHPTIAPMRSTFSVFHQLHCLNALRGGYWASHHAALQGIKIKDEELPVDIQESHMRHCVDLLRQSLMCLADTTLEVVDEKINGVHGFRTEHQCKNWEQLKEWTSAQQKRQHVEQIV